MGYDLFDVTRTALDDKPATLKDLPMRRLNDLFGFYPNDGLKGSTGPKVFRSGWQKGPIFVRLRHGRQKGNCGDSWRGCGSRSRRHTQESVEIPLRQQNSAAEFLIGQAGQGDDLIGDSRGLAGQNLLI